MSREPTPAEQAVLNAYPDLVHLGRRGGEQVLVGVSRLPEYACLKAAVQRCENPRASGYEDYGGRGIRVSPEWRDDFLAFFVHIGKRPRGTSIDRIDVDGHYEPGNVRWATSTEQARNKRRHRVRWQGPGAGAPILCPRARHPRTPDNWYFWEAGALVCRPCWQEGNTDVYYPVLD